MKSRAVIGIVLLFVSFAPAQRQPAQTQPAQSKPAQTQPAPHRWLLHLPGIGGHMIIDDLVTRGLHDALPDLDIQIYDWTGEDRGLASLTHTQRHVEQAAVVARMIEKHAREHPDQPITLTAHSAGTGIAVWALEDLSDDVQIDDLLLIASALSPKYDLTKALRHVKHRAYAFNSQLDVIVLGSGTSVMGTVDGVKTEAAGKVGFKMPKDADANEYKKLVQFPYDPDWMRFGNTGEHIGPMMRGFARNVIARVLSGEGLPPRPTTRPASQPATSDR